MSPIKRIGRADAVRRSLSWIISRYIRFVWATNRWTIERNANADHLMATKTPYIAAFWHGRLLMMPYGRPPLMPLAMLISPHADGRLIAETVNRLGIDIIPGSTNRGASEALRNMVRTLRQGSCIGITPDGPDGPAMSSSLGIVQVARLTGASISALTYATSRRVMLPTWDHFHLPLPFGRGTIIFDEPLAVPRDADQDQIEALRVLLETRMRAITAEADRRMGHGMVAPGTLSREAFRAHRRATAGRG